MEMSYRIVVAFIAVSLTGSGSALAQSSPQTPPSHVAITTRLVALFSDLEEQWLNAIQKKDSAALDHLLGDEFQVWTAAPPGSPIPREDWQVQSLASPPASFQLSQMAVRTVADNVAIASFVLQTSLNRNGAAVSQRHFIVDVWTKGGDNWVCTDRYQSELSGSASAVRSDIHPTGKR